MAVRKPSWSRLIPSCLHYRGFLVPRKRRRSSETAASGLGGGGVDTHDIRLLETYVPMSLLTTPAGIPGIEEGHLSDRWLSGHPPADPFVDTMAPPRV